MAGLKLKSGADLCGFELNRFCVQNDVVAPDVPASGRKYFHKGTGKVDGFEVTNRERIYTGSSWRTTAYLDDLANLDVANNADFQKLKDKVDLLSGEVDTDAIINNMKDVENFLAGFNESGGTLMNYLNTELGKKFNKLGGTISGTLKVSSSGSSVPFTVETTKSAYVAMIMRTNAGHNGHFIYAGDSTWRVSDAGWNHAYTLLHEGNVGDYAPLRKARQATIDLNTAANGFYEIGYTGQTLTNAPLNGNALFVDFRDGAGNAKMQFVGANNSAALYFRSHQGGLPEVTSTWKTIAFTDSNVASATKLETPRTIWGQSFDGTGNVSGTLSLGNDAIHGGASSVNMLWCDHTDTLYLGYGMCGVGGSVICGNAIAMRYGSSRVMGFLLNSSGNVGIGTTDPKAKLHVGGNILLNNRNNLAWIKSDGNIQSILQFERDDKLHLGYGLTTSFTVYPLSIFENDIQSKGDIVANGTIACKGVAAEGSEVGMGTVDKKVLSIPSSTTQQTFSLTHGLNTREITVCIYEITSTGTNMILTDVEITGDNTISVSFGNPPSENHMVVVMG